VTRTDDDNVQVELVGCTGLGSHISVDRAAVAEGRLKIQFGAGYEHFDLDHFSDSSGDGDPVPVFVWTDRTWIAE
jgi:hypothetical protein